MIFSVSYTARFIRVLDSKLFPHMSRCDWPKHKTFVHVLCNSQGRCVVRVAAWRHSFWSYISVLEMVTVYKCQNSTVLKCNPWVKVNLFSSRICSFMSSRSLYISPLCPPWLAWAQNELSKCSPSHSWWHDLCSPKISSLISNTRHLCACVIRISYM